MNTSLTTGNILPPLRVQKGGALQTNDVLRIGDFLWVLSSNRQYGFFAVLQPNGDLRFYYSLPRNPGSIDPARPYYSLVADAGPGYVNGSWRFDPMQNDGRYYAIMQADGNLVIYRGPDPSASQGPCWATNTFRSGVGPAYQAVLTGDGNLEVHRTSGADTSTIWQSRLDYPGKRVVDGASLATNQWVAHPARLVSAKQATEAMFAEGGGITTMCSIPPGMGQAWAYQAWSNRASARGPLFTIMQGDGNLVTYRGTDPAHSLGAVWATFANAQAAGAYVAAIRDDGTLGVYAGDDPATAAAPLWGNGGTNPHATTVRDAGGAQQLPQTDANTVAGWTSTAPVKVQFLLTNGVPLAGATVRFTTDPAKTATMMFWTDPAAPFDPQKAHLDPGNPSTAGEVTVTTDHSGFATSPVAWCHPDGTNTTFTVHAQGLAKSGVCDQSTPVPISIQVLLPPHPHLFYVDDTTFDAKVVKSPIPTLVMFWAAWDGGSRALAPVYERASDEWENLGFAKLDIDANEMVPTQLGIKAIPAIVLYCGGKVVERLDRPQPSLLSQELDRMRSSCPPPSYWPAAQ